MSDDPKTNEWNLLKAQFDALVHDENVSDDSIEKILDAQFRRRFAELINRAAGATPSR
ncbi:MAG: hypothetical protein WCD13_24020 [Pseudolabrys sp.]